MWEFDLHFLGCTVAVFSVSKHVALSASKVIETVHVIDSLDFFLEKVWIVPQQVADVHWETNRCNCDRVVRLFLKHLHVLILYIRDIVGGLNIVIGEVVNKIFCVLVLISPVSAKGSLVCSKWDV